MPPQMGTKKIARQWSFLTYRFVSFAVTKKNGRAHPISLFLVLLKMSADILKNGSTHISVEFLKLRPLKFACLSIELNEV